MSRRKGPRHLRPEEAALWELIASRTQPLHPRRKPDPPPRRPRRRRSPNRGRLSPLRDRREGRAPAPRHDLARPIASALAAAPVAMDRKAHRKLTRGKLQPEARIDLHGMTLADAHPALLASWPRPMRVA
jgi:DNA-nicking Smr family endonuclease